MAKLTRIDPRWSGAGVVAAPGPSLPLAPLWLTDCRRPTIAVCDAYRLLPNAHAMFACDARWWDQRLGAKRFKGERWSSHNDVPTVSQQPNDKTEAQDRWELKLVEGFPGSRFMPRGGVCYGNNSGFQAINLAILFGLTEIYLIGFDMHNRRGGHYFGNHSESEGLAQGKYERFVRDFVEAAMHMPPGIEIFNCTPGSALQCFPYVDPYDHPRFSYPKEV